MTEIVAPAGSFNTAIYAFRGGAHAVYIGLEKFSARKQSKNFTIEQLRKLKSFARANGRKIYVAINTIVKEDELEDLITALYHIEKIGVTAIIVQDMGAIEIVKKYFPSIELHASTQMAVHNDAGVRFLKKLGVKRVVLSREVPFEEIKKIRHNNPDMELEVFVHGALCYSFSGLCLASAFLCGRSGNRGECAQICRNSYDFEGNSGCYFSSNDLFLGEEILKLRDIGIDALKIEGRMKSAEYVFNTVKLYDTLLSAQRPLHRDDLSDLSRESLLSFGRSSTTGYFHDRKGRNIIDSEYTTHRGVAIGRVLSAAKNSFVMKIAHRLHERDGLMFFVDNDQTRPSKFSAKRVMKDDEQVLFCEGGSVVTVMTDNLRDAPQKGQEIFHLSSRFLDLPMLSDENTLEAYQISLAAEVIADSDRGLIVRFRWDSQDFEFVKKIDMFEGRVEADFVHIITALFSQSNKNLVTVDDLTFINRTSFSDRRIFIPPSLLKKFKNEFYLFLNETLDNTRRAYVAYIMGDAVAEAKRFASPEIFERLGEENAARRELFNPKTAEGLVPFIKTGKIDSGEWAEVCGMIAIPLPPVLFDDVTFFRTLEDTIAAHTEKTFLIGLNNIHHIEYAQSLQRYDNVWFFVDFYLYIANRFSLAFYQKHIPKLMFAYGFIEDRKPSHELPVITISKDFLPPLFYSLSCFYRNSLAQGCSKECTRSHGFDIMNRKRSFRVVCEECVTYLFDKGY